MIDKHQHYDLLGKIVLERVIFTPPLRLKEQLYSEACLLYSIKGNSTLYISLALSFFSKKVLAYFSV